MKIFEIQITQKNDGYEIKTLLEEKTNGKTKVVDDPNFRYWTRTKDACFEQLKELMSDWK